METSSVFHLKETATTMQTVETFLPVLCVHLELITIIVCIGGSFRNVKLPIVQMEKIF